jgi:arsenite-transporting ATPase
VALLLRPVTFVGGKGGVGKTTVAAALALVSADSGARTLLVSTDPAHSTSDVLETRLGEHARRVVDGLDALEIDPRAEAERYIGEVKERIRQVTSPRMLGEVEREVDVARASPGAEEAALFDRFARLMPLAGGDYDRVIFDTAPTGQTLRLLGLPELMEAWVEGLVSRRRKLRSLGRRVATVGSSTIPCSRHSSGARPGSAKHGGSSPTPNGPGSCSWSSRSGCRSSRRAGPWRRSVATTSPYWAWW